MSTRLIAFFIMTFFLSSCLTTITMREDGITKRGSAPPISEVRQENAELKSKLMNYEEDLRIKNGRIEELEVYIKGLKKNSKQELKLVIEEREAYKESLASMNKEKVKLLNQLDLLKEQYKESSEKLKWVTAPLKSLLKRGDKLFNNKKWAEAVRIYEYYRERVSNKNSSKYAMVTYKIGVCFQELKLIKEAKTFYKSVVDNFDEKFKAHKFASYRLSTLSK